jgi:hypothetical protein
MATFYNYLLLDFMLPGGYLYGVLCPKLMDYNLVEKIDYKDDRTNFAMVKYQTTENGNKFFQLVEKVALLKKEVS